MEENLFEYRHDFDEEYAKKVIKYKLFKTPGRVIILIIEVLIVLWLLSMAIHFTILGAGESVVKLWIPAVGYLVFLVVYTVFGYKRALSLTRRQLSELYGDRTVTMEVSVTESDIFWTDNASNSENSVAIDSVVKITESGELIILKTRARITITLSRVGFTKGTPEEFVAFMRAKIAENKKK